MHESTVVGRLEIRRLLEWARRCRDLSDMTVVPVVTRELIALAQEMEDAAENADRR